MYIAEALTLLQTIKQLQTTPIARQIKFGYMLAYNRRLLETVEETYKTALQSPDDEAENAVLQRFEQDRITALEAAAEKDSNGQPLIENNSYVITDPGKTLPKIEKKLTTAYPTVAAIIQERTRRADALGREQQEIALRRLPITAWPELPESLSSDMINSVLLHLVSED